MNFENEHKENIGKEIPSFAGYRIIEFAKVGKDALKEVADRLIPHEHEIVESWIETQYRAWPPATITRSELRKIFGDILYDMLHCMSERTPEKSLENLDEAGAKLASQKFPYEALIISLHFLEESYLPFLKDSWSEKTYEWLTSLDEFLHAALAIIATSYFQAYRKDLLQEAEVGRIVQEGLLPDIPKQLVDLEVAYIYLPAGEQAQVGGDLVDIFAIEPKGAAFIVGDLSGHGLEAATDAAMLRYLFRGFIREDTDLSDTMGRLNRLLKIELESNQFATALAGVYDGDGGLKLASAGHPMPVVCGNVCRLLEPNGIALGIEERSVYLVNEFELGIGDTFVAYTDGLIEARSEEGFFGDSRVVDAVAKLRKASARSIAEQLIDEALRFAGGKLTDDVAILVLKRL